MFMDHNFWKVLFILLFLAAIVVALLPLITGGKWKLWNQIPAAAVSALSVLWLLIVFVAASVSLIKTLIFLTTRRHTCTVDTCLI
jgi:hypothetical protein